MAITMNAEHAKVIVIKKEVMRKKNTPKISLRFKMSSMKHILLLLLFSGSLSAFSQAADTKAPLREYNWSGPQPVVKPDTLRAIVLVTYTTQRWGIAHARDGFVVVKSGEVIAFFTDKMECFPPDTELWGWRKPDEKFKKSKHGKN